MSEESKEKEREVCCRKRWWTPVSICRHRIQRNTGTWDGGQKWMGQMEEAQRAKEVKTAHGVYVTVFHYRFLNLDLWDLCSNVFKKKILVNSPNTTLGHAYRVSVYLLNVWAGLFSQNIKYDAMNKIIYPDYLIQICPKIFRFFYRYYKGLKI